MTTLLYSLLFALNLITSTAEFNQLPIGEQQELLIIVTDEVL